MKKLNNKELEKMHETLWDLNTRKIKGEDVTFPKYSEDEILQLRDWQRKKFRSEYIQD